MNRFAYTIIALVCTVLCTNASMTELGIDLPKQGDVRVLTIDPDGGQKVSVTFDVPVSDIQQIRRPDHQQRFWSALLTAVGRSS